MTSASHSDAGAARRSLASALRCGAAALLVFASGAWIAPSAGAATGATPGGATASAFDAQGMWIWYVTRSNGGNVPAIVARAKRARIGTVYIKAGDGPTAWSQFTSSLVSARVRPEGRSGSSVGMRPRSCVTSLCVICPPRFEETSLPSVSAGRI